MAETAARRYIEIEVAAGKALRELEKISGSMEKVEKSANRASKGVQFMTRALKGFVAFKAVQYLGDLAASLGDAADASTDMAAQLRSVTKNSVGTRKAYEDLFDLTLKNGVATEDLVNGYVRLATSVPTAEHEELVQILDTTSTVLATTGAATQQVNAVMLQLAQGLSSGAVQGDEFRSVAENAPVLLLAWREALGRTETSLKELSKEGVFTTESFLELNDAIQRNSEVMIGATEPADTLGRSWQRLTSGFTTFIGGLDKQAGALAGTSSVMESLGESLNALGLAMGAMSESFEDTQATMDPKLLAEYREELQFVRAEIFALEGMYDSLNDAQKENLQDLADRTRFLQRRLPEERLLHFQSELLKLEKERDELASRRGVYRSRAAAQARALDANEIADLKEKIRLTEEQIRKTNAYAQELKDVPEPSLDVAKLTEEFEDAFKVADKFRKELDDAQRDALDSALDVADKFGDQIEKALGRVSELTSAYEEDSRDVATYGSIQNLIDRTNQALADQNTGLAQKLAEEAREGLKEFGKNADDLLRDFEFQGLKKRLEEATLNAFTGAPVDKIRTSVLTTVQDGVVTGYRDAASIIADEALRVSIWPVIEGGMRRESLERGGRTQ